MHSEAGFENLVFKNTSQAALERFASALEWPPHLKTKHPDYKKNTAAALADYFASTKGNWGISDFLAQCSEMEIPASIRDVCIALKKSCEPQPATQPKA